MLRTITRRQNKLPIISMDGLILIVIPRIGSKIHKRTSDRINRRPNMADFFCRMMIGRPYKKLVLSNRGREKPESSLESPQFPGSYVGAKGTSWTASRCKLLR